MMIRLTEFDMRHRGIYVRADRVVAVAEPAQSSRAGAIVYVDGRHSAIQVVEDVSSVMELIKKKG